MNSKFTFSSLITALLLLFSVNTYAGDGGAASVTPGTGVKVLFGGGADIWIPIRFEAEGFLGEEGQHGVGGEIGFDIGTGFTPGFFGIKPQYNFYFNGGQESGGYVGAYADLRFRSLWNIIGVGAQGGYVHYFNDMIAIFGEANVGYGTIGYTGGSGSGRSHNGEFGVSAGLKIAFGG